MTDPLLYHIFQTFCLTIWFACSAVKTTEDKSRLRSKSDDCIRMGKMWTLKFTHVTRRSIFAPPYSGKERIITLHTQNTVNLFISRSLLLVGTRSKKCRVYPGALTNVPLFLANIRDHLFFGIGSFCCRVSVERRLSQSCPVHLVLLLVARLL